MRRLVAALAVVVVVLVGAAGIGVLSALDSAQPSAPAPEAACPQVAAVTVGSIRVPAGPIGGFCQPELINAAHIINAARTLGIGQHTQAIGVMTAIGESGLINLAHGDAAGPDSRGLFQQRANGSWGSLRDRMTPYRAAYNFFAALVAIPGWKSLTPTRAAHTVQRNADPGYYGQYWDTAVAIVTDLNR